MRLAAENDLIVIGEAADCEIALTLAIANCPDIVLLDADMMFSDGIAVANILHTTCPTTSVIILSMHDDAHLCKRAEQAGVAGFVGKSQPLNTLLTTIREVAG